MFVEYVIQYERLSASSHTIEYDRLFELVGKSDALARNDTAHMFHNELFIGDDNFFEDIFREHLYPYYKGNLAYNWSSVKDNSDPVH